MRCIRSAVSVFQYMAPHVFRQLLQEQHQHNRGAGLSLGAIKMQRVPLSDGCGVTYLLHRLLHGKKCAAASPVTSDRLQVWVGVISEEMLHEVVLNAEDQGTVLPLIRRARIRKQVKNGGAGK